MSVRGSDPPDTFLILNLTINMIKGIIFDYGGTIDSGGEHWSEVIWRGWQHAGLSVPKPVFRDAYVEAERELARRPHIIESDTFFDLLLKKMRIELQHLLTIYPEAASRLGNAVLEEKALAIAKFCDAEARRWVEHSRPVLEELGRRYPLVLVSNFYGNVSSVLKEYDLLKCFKTIVESAVVGVRKPDPQIFVLGVEALGLPAEEVLVVGDSYRKDIVPALKAGCRAIWIKGKGWTDEEDAQTYTYIIKDLQELPAKIGELQNA